MSNRHSVRKGIAALLSVLSVGGIASAKNPRPNLSKSQNVAPPKGKKNSGKVVKKRNLSKNQNLNSNSKKILEGKPKNQKSVPSNKASITTNGTFFSHVSGAGKELKSAFGRLSPTQRGILIACVAESASVLHDGRGAIERVNNFTLSWLIEALREKIFGNRLTKVLNDDAESDGDYSAIKSSIEIRKQYEMQQSAEELVASKWGPVFGIFAKLSYYLKDSFWDFFAAFWHGCTDKLKDVREDRIHLIDDVLFKDNDIKAEDVADVGFGNYFDARNVANWGPQQVKLWWLSVNMMGWKRSALNNWAYNLGAAVFNAEVRKASELRRAIEANTDDNSSKEELVKLFGVV